MPRNHPHCHHHHENRVRRGQWCALTAFSIVALVAMTSRFDSDIQSEAMETQWVASAISVVLATAALTAMAHFALREVFVGSFVEGGLVRFRIIILPCSD
jgi:hypothetical protein